MNDSGDKSPIAVVGLGNMGSALAAALLARGYSVLVWNRTASKADALVAKGAKPARDVAEAARQARATIVCVANHAAFESAVHHDDVADALRDRCLIQLGVVTASQAQEHADWAQSRGIGYLEGSVLGVPDLVAAGTANLVCSGPADLFAEYRPMLEVFGTAYHLSPAIGAAYQFDKMIYPLGYGTSLGFIQGAAMVKAAGYSLDTYTNILAAWAKMLADRFATYGALLEEENYSVYQGSLEVWRDAYRDGLELCRSLGVDDSLPKAHLAMMNKGMDAGFGNEEILAVYKALLPRRTSDDDKPHRQAR